MTSVLYTIVFFIPAILAGVAYLYYSKQAQSNNWGMSDSESKLLIQKELEKLSYYRTLSQSAKDRFAVRTWELTGQWTFVGVEEMVITPEVEILVCASAIQLSFGLKAYVFGLFHTVFVYPNPFFVGQLGQELRGGVSPAGNIHLSWKNFTEGFKNGDDGLNLALHEMSHALMITSLKEHPDEELTIRLDSWLQFTTTILENIPAEYSSFLRSYAFTNTQEFFAVCVENFFERPIEMKAEVPELYFQLAYLLNQDPINVHADFALRPQKSPSEINSEGLFV